jgi:hypothetical protein
MDRVASFEGLESHKVAGGTIAAFPAETMGCADDAVFQWMLTCAGIRRRRFGCHPHGWSRESNAHWH